MKQIAILVASVALAASTPIISGSPAAATTPGCVTHQEFNAVHRGMRKAHVHQVFDTTGRVASRDANRMHRYYKICHVPFTRSQAVHVVYRHDHGVWEMRRKWADAE